MAKKSDNIQGNPWHDEGSGQFTSQDGGSAPSNDNEEEKAMGLMGLDKKKGNVGAKIDAPAKPTVSRKISQDQDIEYIKQALQQRNKTREYEEKGLKTGRDTKECEEIGSSILGAGIVAYSDGLEVNQANQLNQCLFDVKNDFPRLFESLARFGTGALNADEVSKIKDDYNGRCLELANSLNIQTEDTKKTITNYLSKIFSSRGHSLLGETERGRWGTLGWYAPTPMDEYNAGEEIKPFVEQREKTVKEAGLAKLGSTREISYYAVTGLSVIQMNPSYFTKEDFRKGTLYESGGFHYTNTKGAAYMTGAHELGHFVDIMLSGNFMNVDELKQRHTLFVNIRNNPNVSGYAKSNYLETAAEAFGDVYSNGSNALPENIEYVNYMKGMYKKYLEDRGNMPVGGNKNGV